MAPQFSSVGKYFIIFADSETMFYGVRVLTFDIKFAYIAIFKQLMANGHEYWKLKNNVKVVPEYLTQNAENN